MLDPTEFKSAAEELAQAWSEYHGNGQGWEWMPQHTAFATGKGAGYLQLARIPAAGRDGSLAFFTYHVVYSPSYRVPVLHFEVHDTGGAPVTGLDVLAFLPELPAAASEEGDPFPSTPLDSVVSQEDHPFLDRPFFQVHPCASQGTLDLMLSPAAGARRGPRGRADLRRYMLAWLSVASQPVPLLCPAAMFTG